MWLLDRLSGRGTPPEPRSYEEIRASVEQRDAVHIQRLNRVEESLFTLTAEVGLEDLRRKLQEHPRDR